VGGRPGAVSVFGPPDGPEVGFRWAKSRNVIYWVGHYWPLHQKLKH
jgi:hypothetical protein